MKLSVTYRTAKTYLISFYSKPTSIWNRTSTYTFGIEKVKIPYTHNNVTSVNCHVPLFNSTQWRTASYAVKENVVVGKTTPSPTQATLKLASEMTKPTTIHSTPSEQGTDLELGLRSEITRKENDNPNLQTRTSTTGGNNPTAGPSGDSSQTQLVILLSVMGVLFPGLFLFIAYCIHRHFTCECLCYPPKSISSVKQDSHILTLMKSEQTKCQIPPSYFLSSKDISLDYSQVVGEGQFSIVHQGYLKLSGKSSVLVKSNKTAGDAIEIAALMNDVQMRILLGETNARITACLSAYFDCIAGKVFIVMKTNTQKNLRELLTIEDVPMGQLTILNMLPHEMVQTFCSWLKGVSQGLFFTLEFLHSNKIVHGNIAAENILGCLKNTSLVSITGFSHSQQLSENLSYFVKSRSWTTGWETSGWRWMPMESLRYMEFSKESDVWSFGVLMWEIFSLGAIPYSEFGYLSMEFIQKLEFGIRLLQPQLSPDDIYRQMETCWSRCGKDRQEAIELCGYFSRGQSKFSRVKVILIKGSPTNDIVSK